jgi:hypothetical protein
VLSSQTCMCASTLLCLCPLIRRRFDQSIPCPDLARADAEMLWCQAVGALFVGMLSELVYTSILGMLGGMAYGKQGPGGGVSILQFACTTQTGPTGQS